MNHVLIDCERTKYPNTGLFHFCLNLGKELIKQTDKAREKLFFYVPSKNEGLFAPGGLPVIQHPIHKIFQANTGKYQVWHSTHQLAAYRPFNNKTKMVLTLHDLNFLIERKEELHKIKSRLAQVQKRINRADYIVSISSFTRQVMLEHLELKDKPVQVIYNGCNINEFPGFDTPLYRPVKPFIFSIGTVLPKKNFHVLPCLLKNNDYELVIAGIINKQYEEKIFEEAARHGVANRVRLTGPVSEKDKFWYYKNCLSFVFPSLAEGFGLPLLEAMFYGKPVFISNLTSLPEIGGDVAYYFESFEAASMQEVFRNGMQHYRENDTASAIQKKAAQFSWVNAAHDYLTVYRKLYQ